MENNQQKPEWSVDGMRYSPPNENAPDFVRGSLSIKIDEFIPFLQKNVNAKGWINIQLLKSKKGTIYLKLDTWKPKEKPQESKTQDWHGPVVKEEPFDMSQVPF